MDTSCDKDDDYLVVISKNIKDDTLDNFEIVMNISKDFRVHY